MGTICNEQVDCSVSVAEQDKQVTINGLSLLGNPRNRLSLDPGFRVETLIRMDRPFSKIVKVKVSKGEQYNNYFIKQFKEKTSGPTLTKLQDRVLQEFKTLSYYHGKFKGVQSLDLPRPVSCNPEQLIVISEELQGEVISEILERSAYLFPSQLTMKRIAQQCKLVGSWLTRFQTFGEDDANGIFKVDGMLNYMDIRLTRLEMMPNVNFCYKERMKLLEKIKSLISQVPESDLSTCGIHADFCPGNCLGSGNGVGVVDFAMYQPGSVYHDLTHFYHRITILRHKPIYRRAVIRFFIEAFLEGYKGKSRLESPLFILFMIQHLVCHFDMIAQRKPGSLKEKIFNQKILSTYARQLRLWSNEIPCDRVLLLHYA